MKALRLGAPAFLALGAVSLALSDMVSPATAVRPAPPIHRPAAYHFSAQGNDALPASAAKHAATPWRSLAKLDSLLLLPGDSVLFNRGDTFFGTLNAGHSGAKGRSIYYGAYGKGGPPILSAAAPVTGWKPFQGRIQAADFSGPARQLFVDGKPMVLARHPNRGYLPIAKAIGDDAFQAAGACAQTLIPGIDWSGSAIQVRSQRFSLDARAVARFDSDSCVFRLDKGTNYALKPGMGFFLNGALAALDTAGEWQYDPASGKIHAWMPDGDSAAAHRVEASVLDYGFRAEGREYLRVENLRFAYPALAGFFLRNASLIEIRNCSVAYPGAHGVDMEGNGLVVEDDTVFGAVQAGILLSGSGARLRNNSLIGTGLPERLGRGGFGGACCKGNGMEFYGDSNLASGNRISVSGHNGIRFEGARNVIEKNLVDSSCLALDDAGGIYTWARTFAAPGSMGSIIRDNIILNTLGNGDGTGDTGTSAHGIYLDDCTQGMRVTGNTIANADVGIYLHNTRDHFLSGNVLYHNRNVQLFLKRDYLVPDEMAGNVAKGNILFSTSLNQGLQGEKIHGVKNASPLAALAGNYLCRIDSSGESCTLDGKRIWRKKRTPGSSLRYNFAGEARSLSPVRGGFQASPDTAKSGRPAPYSSQILIPGASGLLPAARSPAPARGGL